MQKQEFLQREARIYHDVYQEIWQASDYVCRQYKFDMVLRFNGEPVDIERPDSVLTWINKPVVWYDTRQDITDAVLAVVNRTPMNPAANGRAPPVRPGVPFTR